MDGDKETRTVLSAIPAPAAVPDPLVRALRCETEDLVYCKDAGGRYTFANHASMQLLGIPPDLLVGRTANDAFSADVAESWSVLDPPVLSGRTVDAVRELKLGTVTRYLHIVQSPIRSEDGTIEGILGIVRDVTESYHLKKDLVASREMFAKAFDTSFDAMAICTEDALRLLEVNEAFLTIVALPKKAVVGKPLTALALGISDDMVRNLQDALLERGEVRDVEVTLRKPGGERLDGLLSASAVTHSRGRMLLMTVKDITRRKQMEELLRIQRDLSLAAGAAAGPDEITECLLDYSLRIEGLDSGSVYMVDEAPQTAEPLLSAGFSDDFLQTVSLKSLLGADRTDSFVAGGPVYMTFSDTGLPTDDFRDGHGLKAMAIVPIRHDAKTVGALHLASHTAEEIPLTAKHTVEAVAGMIGGAFARAKAEKALRESEERLRQSEKMEAIGQLAGGMAHDFNNQLMGITGYADLLQGQVKENPKAARFVQSILLAARRSADLTAQLLAFARKGKYLSVSVDIHKTIQEVINLLSHSIDKKIAIRCHLRAEPCITTGDPTQLQNAVLNLALNARDAMPGGGDLIFTTDTVCLEAPRSWDNPPFELPAGDYLSIGISDTGTGISREVQRRIFEPFFTTKEQGKGTGMGLAAVFGTIKNHKGAVTLDSAPKKGTSFRILLPLHPPKPITEEISHISGTASFDGLRVLLVDDEETVLTVGREMLTHLGCNTRIARNGKEALKAVQQHREGFDLVILDMIMPEMNGKDALLLIKKADPKQRVLLSSGYSMDAKISEFSTDPRVRFIQKPFRLEELCASMETLLSNSSKGTLQK